MKYRWLVKFKDKDEWAALGALQELATENDISQFGYDKWVKLQDATSEQMNKAPAQYDKSFIDKMWAFYNEAINS